MSCVGPDATLFSSYIAVLRFVLQRRYLPWKQHFLGDSLLRICEMCIKHEGQEFEQCFAAPHCHFLLQVQHCFPGTCIPPVRTSCLMHKVRYSATNCDEQYWTGETEEDHKCNFGQSVCRPSCHVLRMALTQRCAAFACLSLSTPDH
jgi:hypothetical protein